MFYLMVFVSSARIKKKEGGRYTFAIDFRLLVFSHGKAATHIPP